MEMKGRTRLRISKYLGGVSFDSFSVVVKTEEVSTVKGIWESRGYQVTTC